MTDPGDFEGDFEGRFVVDDGSDSDWGNEWSDIVEFQYRLASTGALIVLPGSALGNSVPSDIALSSTSVAENQPEGTVVGIISGIDPDAGQSATLIFSLVSGYADNASFTIDSATKQLKTASVFDYEGKNSYDIKVRATDTGSPALSYEEAFTIAVTNVDEAPTDINLSNSSVAENQPSGTVVGVLSGSDPDAGRFRPAPN